MEIQKRIYLELNRISKGNFGILLLAFRRFSRSAASEAAASLAYYAFFSLFPLLLVLISAGSFALERASIAALTFRLLSDIIPGSAGFIETSIEQVLDQRGPVGVVGVVGLVWSASGAFSGLVKHVNRAWPGADRRGTLYRRFVGVGLVLVLLILFAAWVASSLMLDVIPRFFPADPVNGGWVRSFFWLLFSGVVPFLVTCLMFFGLYKWIPAYKVHWRVAFWGALVAAAGSEIVTNLFGWYITSGFAGYSLVYGSLGAVVAFMFWVYLMCNITLFGAHLSAALGYFHRRELDKGEMAFDPENL